MPGDPFHDPLFVSSPQEYPLAADILTRRRRCSQTALAEECCTRRPGCASIATCIRCLPELSHGRPGRPHARSPADSSRFQSEVCGLREAGACCYASGYCLTSSMDECTYIGGTWLGWGTFCEPSPCGADPYGACCLPGGACEVLVQSGCAQAGGRYLGAGTDCAPNPCSTTPAQPATWGRIKSEFR